MKRLKSFFVMTLICIFLLSSLGVNAATLNISGEDTRLGYITNLQCDVVANSVTVSGTAAVDSSNTATVTFWIKQNTTNKDLVFWQHKTGATGKFKLRFTLDTSKYNVVDDDAATLMVGGLGLNTYSTSTIPLYTQTQIDACKTDFLNIGSGAGSISFSEFFTNHAAMLGITTSYTTEELELIEKYHMANPPTGSETNDEIVAKIAALNTKLQSHKALIAAISTAASGDDADTLAAIFDATLGASNIALLKDYYGGETAYNAAFGLNDIVLTDSFWNRLINSPASYTTIESFAADFSTARTAQTTAESECANYFKNIDGSTKTSQQFFTLYGSLIGISVTSADELAIFDTYYEQRRTAGDIAAASTVTDTITIVSEIVNKLTRHKALVNAVSAAAQGSDSDLIGDLLTDPSNADLTGFVTLDCILNEVSLWARMLNSNGYSSLSEIETAFTAAYNAQLENERNYGGTVTSTRTKNFLDQWSIKNVANLITIKGAHPDTATSNITYHISGKNGGISSTDPEKTIMIAQGKTYREGSAATNSVFEMTFPLNTARFDTGAGDETTGVFRVSANDTNTHQFYITLYPQSRVDSLIADFAAIQNVNDLKTFIDGDENGNGDYAGMLSVSGGYSADKLAVMKELYDENKAAFQGITDSVAVAERFTELETGTTEVMRFITDLNAASNAESARWGTFRKVIETTYSDKKLDEVSKTYADLLQTAKADSTAQIIDVQSLYNKMLGKTYTTVQSVIDAYDTAKQEVIDESGSSVTPGPPGSAGGTVGGGGGNRNEVEVGDGFIVEDITTEIPADELPVAPFTDLSGYSWAQTAINNLRQRGIIRGDGDGKYRPAQEMTREEFLSVLLKTFNIQIESGSISLSDVDPDEWYADIVATALKIGVTNGIGDGKFGIGQKITRSDMVVMAARLAASCGVNIQQKEAAVIFEDYTKIPDYAYEAVVAFQQAGFINGDDNGYFNPTDATTRAESAVFFWSMFDYMN